MGTLHANNSSQTIDRVINFFPEERRNQLLMDLSSNLRAIVSQRLVKTVDGKGRRAAIEILLNTPTIAERIFKGQFNDLKGIMEKSRELGTRTFDWALFDLFNSDQISYEEAIRNADSANELRLNIKLKSKKGEPSSGETQELSIDHGPTEEELEAQRQEELAKQEDKRKEVQAQQLIKMAEEKKAKMEADKAAFAAAAAARPLSIEPISAPETK